MTRGVQSSAVFASAGFLALSAVACTPGTGTEGGKAPIAATNESWCPEGFEIGPAETCFSIPEHPTKDTAVVVYLHGLFEKKGSPAEWAAAKTAVARGFALVLPRGKRALCPWRSDAKDQYCWPQDPEDTPTIKQLIAEWDRVLWQVDALLEGGTHKRYVLGNGDGGAFAAFIATHGLFPAQAYAVVGSGGLGAPGKARAVPMLLLGSQDDPEHGPKTKELHDALSRASWPHAFCPRSGPPGIGAEDVDAALRFFKRDAEGTLKPQAGSFPCR
jgi:poly(3-hydroxybutyrate) depolymerase